MLEVLVYALEMDLESELAFKVMSSLLLILHISGCHVRKAHQLGLTSSLAKFEDCQHPKRVVLTAY
jgi:hypothetical protein